MFIITIMLRVGDVLPHSDPTVVFVFLELFVIATVMFCFLVSTLFSRASTAAAASGIVWFMSYVPYFFIGPNYSSYGMGIKEGLSILSTTAMAIGANVISSLEGQGIGVQWSNIANVVSVDDAMTFGTVWGLLFWDAILYALLTWYIEAVFPGDFGIPRPWYFFVTSSYWCGTRVKSSEERTPLMVRTMLSSNLFLTFQGEAGYHAPTANFEVEPTNVQAGISINHLRKVQNPYLTRHVIDNRRLGIRRQSCCQ